MKDLREFDGNEEILRVGGVGVGFGHGETGWMDAAIVGGGEQEGQCPQSRSFPFRNFASI